LGSRSSGRSITLRLNAARKFGSRGNGWRRKG